MWKILYPGSKNPQKPQKTRFTPRVNLALQEYKKGDTMSET